MRRLSPLRSLRLPRRKTGSVGRARTLSYRLFISLPFTLQLQWVKMAKDGNHYRPGL